MANNRNTSDAVNNTPAQSGRRGNSKQRAMPEPLVPRHFEAKHPKLTILPITVLLKGLPPKERRGSRNSSMTDSLLKVHIDLQHRWFFYSILQRFVDKASKKALKGPVSILRR